MEQLLLHLIGDYVTQTDWMARTKTRATFAAACHAVVYTLPFALLSSSPTALTVIAYLWSRMAGVAGRKLADGAGNRPLLEAKKVSARYYFERLLPESQWLLQDITSGKDSMMAFTAEHWQA